MLTILMQTPNPSQGVLVDLIVKLFPIYTPILVPLVIVVLRKFVDQYVAKPMWPLITPALGVVLDYVRTLTTGVTSDPVMGALLGAVGVFVYEVFNSMRKYMETPDAPPAA